jgi:hypothetical protein
MLCDGRQITQANYNTEHGADTWTTFIGSSPLTNKYLPNLTGKYLVGDTVTSQDGTSTITSVGWTANTANLSHRHNVAAHNHVWYQPNNSATAGNTFDVSGSSSTLLDTTLGAGSPLHIAVGDTSTSRIIIGQSLGGAFSSLYTNNASPQTDLTLTSVSIQPESIKVQYYMRII